MGTIKGEAIKEITNDLRLDAGDDSLDERIAERAIMRSLAVINADVGASYQVVSHESQNETVQLNDIIEPEMATLHRELLLLQALAHLVRIKRYANDVTVSFKSGDKSVTRTANNWQDLEKVLLGEYQRLLNTVASQDSQAQVSNDIIILDVKPGSYKREIV